MHAELGGKNLLLLLLLLSAGYNHILVDNFSTDGGPCNDLLLVSVHLLALLHVLLLSLRVLLELRHRVLTSHSSISIILLIILLR